MALHAVRLVLDTNVVLDWLLFADAGCAALSRTIDQREVSLLTSEACLRELHSVLERPALCATPSVAGKLLQRYGEQAQLLVPASRNDKLPLCSDPDDQKFLELAADGGASALISRDKALLRLTRRLARSGAAFTVIHPALFQDWFNRLPSGDSAHQPATQSD